MNRLIAQEGRVNGLWYSNICLHQRPELCGIQGKRKNWSPCPQHSGWGVIYDIDMDNLLKLDIPW